ncbi:hypothetical protein N2152v2_008678 [Parachlorella kessleri]
MASKETLLVQQGVLVQQGNGYLSPGIQNFLCCSEKSQGGNGEDPRFAALPAGTVSQAVQEGALECPALWVDAAAVQAGFGPLQVVYRLGGDVIVRKLPLKPIKLQPVKQGAGPAGVTFRAFVSSSTYLQAYRVTVGLLPKLHTLHDHLASSGIPLAPAGQAERDAAYSCDGLRAFALPEGLLLERWDAASGQRAQLKVSINFQNACLELHDASPDAASGASCGCLRTINTLAEAVVALEGRPGAGPASASPVKRASTRGATLSPAKPPLPSGLDSLASSAIIMGGIEALVSAAASVVPSAVMGMSELHALLSQALGTLLDVAPASSHAAARAVTVAGAVLNKNCANPTLLCRVLAAMLQRPAVRLEAMHQGLATAISAAYMRLAPGLEQEAQALLAEVQSKAGQVTAPYDDSTSGTTGPGAQLQAAISNSLRLPDSLPPAPAAPPAPSVQLSVTSAGSWGQPGLASRPASRSAASGAAFGSPQVLLVDAPTPAAGPQRHGVRGVALVAKPAAASPALKLRAGLALQPVAQPAYGRDGYVAHMVSTFNAGKLDEQPELVPVGSPPARAGSALDGRNSSMSSPQKALSPARSASAMSISSARVPRLQLPGSESPSGSICGLTRSTRRALGSSPAGRRSPSPTRFGSPVGRHSDEAVEVSAAAELAALGNALGEALMAADLPAIVAHKRRANAAAGSLEEELPAELLQPPTPGVRKSLEAHRIFVTAKSLRSIESSPSATTDSSAVSRQLGGPVARTQADIDALKCLLLDVLLASLPVVGSLGYPLPDPSSALAMEVLLLMGQSVSSQQDQLMQLCLKVLQQLSLPAAPPTEGPAHALLALAAAKLSRLVPELGGQSGPGPAVGEAAALLKLMTEYISASQSHSVAVAAVQHCGTVIQQLVGVLMASGLDASDWGQGPWRLLHHLAALVAAVCSKCHDAKSGRLLLRELLADQQTGAMLCSAASLALLRPEVVGSAAFPYRVGAAPLQRELLNLLIELAGLIGRQPPQQQQQRVAADVDRAPSRMNSVSSVAVVEEPTANASAGPAGDLLLAPGPKGGKRLSRAQAFDILWPILSPQSGLARRILDHEPSRKGSSGRAATTPSGPASGDCVRLRHAVLQLLKVAFSAPGNPFVADKATTDFYIQFHFIQFLKLYHNPQRDHQARALCKKHMEVLLALASSKLPHSRKRFQQLSMMDFFVREVSLEFECSEPRVARPRVSRSGSTEPRRRSSSFSLDGDTTRRLSDRSAREGFQSVLLAKPDAATSANTPPMVPALRLVPRPAESSFSVSQAQQQPMQQQQQLPAGRLPLGLNIPRLNLPGTPPLGSPVESQSPIAPLSSRLGRPPLPPSARTARMGTPRTSRLGRPGTEGFTPFTQPAGTSEAGPPSKAVKSPFAIHVHAGTAPSSGYAPPAADAAAAPTGLGGRVPVPKLGLGRAGMSLSLPSRAQQLTSPGSDGSAQQGPSPSLPQAPGSAAANESDDSSDEEEESHVLCGGRQQCRSGHSRPPRTRAAAAAGQQSQEGGRRPSMAIPRLNLAGSMHSNLETRTASAELQVALDAERAKRKVGRTFLGDLEKSVLGKGKMQAVSLRPKSFLTDWDAAVTLEVSYDDERAKRLLYKDDTLHLQVLQLIFILLSPSDGQLDPAYSDQLPWQRKMLNIPHILHHHFNHPNTRVLLPRLLPLLHGLGPAAMRLLRVLCGVFFRPDWYKGSRTWIGKGAYAQVYRYQLPEWTGQGAVVFKVLDLPRHFEDHCRQVDFFNEVSIMQALEDSWSAASTGGLWTNPVPSPRAVQLLDFGIDTTAEAMFIVMRDYRCSLRKWREVQPADPSGQLRLYLAIFQQVLSAVKALMEANVLHFDIKCDNVLLEPLPGVGEAQFWCPSSASPPFRVVLADFGESKLFTGSLDGAVTVRNRGTECAKSPEMLLAANAAKKDARTYDRRRREGAGAASDVWSLGCLLFELLTGQFLFSVEPDWVRFFVHITDPRSGALITPDKAQAVQHLRGVEELLHGSRIRMPSYTPPPVQGSMSQALSAPLPSSFSHSLQSPTMLYSPKPAAPLPLLAPLPIAPGLLLAPLTTAQSAQALQRQPLRRVVLLVAALPVAALGEARAADTEFQPSPSKPSASRTARALLAPIGNTLPAAGGPGSASASPRQPGLGGFVRAGSTAAGSEPCSLESSPTKSAKLSGGGPPSSTATSRLGTPRGAGSSKGTAAAARGGEGSRRPARPLFNSARVHAASATDVPSVFETARGPELGGCSEWPGSSSALSSSAAGAAESQQQQRLSQQGEVRPASRRATGTPPYTPRACHGNHPLLPPGFSDSYAAQRSAGEDAAYQHLLGSPELACCGSACSQAGIELKLVPCPGNDLPSTGGDSHSSQGAAGALPLHRWLSLALPVLDGSASRGGGAGGCATECDLHQPEGGCAPVLLAPEPGCEVCMAALAVAYLMQQHKQGLYHAMVQAAAWGIDLHLGLPELRALQQWADGLSS